MIRYLLLFAISGLLAIPKIYSQPVVRVINELVTSQEDGMGLPGVMVYVKGTKKTSGTQEDGMYYIEVTDRDSVLVFSYEDFQTQELRLGSCNNYNIVLARSPAHGKAVLVNANSGQLQGEGDFFKLIPY